MNNFKHKNIENHILVTGSHRSGSTFIGKMLALPQNVGYVSETFNYPEGVRGIDEKFPFFRKGSENEQKYRKIIENILDGKAEYNRSSLFKDKNPIKIAGRILLKSRAQIQYKKIVKDKSITRFLLKDPLACLSAEYFKQEFGMDVVIIIRHPAAFVASIQRVNWEPNFDSFFREKELITGVLSFLPDELKQANSFIEKGALLWKAIYTVLTEIAKNNPDIIVVNHEDISLNPLAEFKSLYVKLGLEYSKEIEEKILEYTKPENTTAPLKNEIHVLKRNSKENVYRFKSLLNKEDIQKIKNITGDLADLYYEDSQW